MKADKMAMQGIRAHAVCRGLFSRIARKLNVDPSYVSRVARGERVSRPIELIRIRVRSGLPCFSIT